MSGALVLSFSTVVPVALTAAAQPAAAQSPCFTSNNCAPANVAFPVPGNNTNVNIPGVPVCGIEGDYAPVASLAIDQAYDDPSSLNGASQNAVIKTASGTTEGNYPNIEAFQFNPAKNTELQAGDTITVSLPHPAEPYSGGGSVLPQPAMADPAGAEQTGSTVTVGFGPTSGSPYGIPGQVADVTVALSGAGAVAGRTVRLDAFNPYNPPAIDNAPGPNVSGNTSAAIHGYNFSDGKYDLGNSATTTSNGVAFFQVNDTSSETVVVAATDTTVSPAVGVLQTATISFNSPTNQSGPCSGYLAAPSGAATNGFTYMVIVNGVGYLVPGVTVSSASGVESATLTVPNGVPTATNSNQVTVVAFDAVSPPGEGTPSNSLPAPNTPYPPSDFSISTSEDPVPGYPGTAPVFQADASSSLLLYPVDPYVTSTFFPPASSLTSSAPSAQVGTSSTGTLTATTTLRDIYNNAVNNKEVSIFQGPGTHANISPQTPPTNTAYPVTAQDGTVTYGISDSCAETVDLESTDVSDNETLSTLTGTFPFLSGAPFTLPVTFTPGPALPPDGTQTPTACGQTPTQSKVTVSVGGTLSGPGTLAVAPSDGVTPATVNVTLADQFGNADSCQQVVLSPAAKTSHATITPQDPPDPCAGDNLPGYTGKNGVASFAVTDSTAETVVLGVADTTVISVWPSNASTNPDDVAQINFEGADPAQSTVVASSSTAPADGQPAATVTVTLKDAAGQVLQGKSVSLAGCTTPLTSPCTPDATTTITPATSKTNASGQAVFQVAGSTPGSTVTYQATDTSDLVVVTETAAITFTVGGASLGANPATVVADGTGTSTVTFVLKDSSGTGIQGAQVSLAASPATGATVSVNNVLTSTATTDSTGTATFTVSDTQAGQVSFTATATYTPTGGETCLGVTGSGGTCTVVALDKVDFIAAPNTFNIVASPATDVPADGVSTSQVTLTALDSQGNPVAALPVELSTTGNAQVAPASGVTASNGQAIFSVTDTTVETVTLSASYQEIGAPSGTSYPAAGCTSATCTATVQFVPTEAEQSTVVASPTSAPADGKSAVTVTVTLLSGSGTPLVGHSVVLTTGSATTTVTSNNVGGLTNGEGAVAFSVTDSQPEALTLYARDTTTGAIIDQTAAVTFVPTELQSSTVVASPTSLPAGGPPGAPNTTTVTVTLVGPVPATCPMASVAGHTVELTSASGTAQISPPVATNSGGVAVFTVSDPAVETIGLTAVDTTCGLTLDQTATVAFTANEANRSTVSVNPVTTSANGPGATLSVTLLSASGAPVSDHQVTVAATGSAVVTPLSLAVGLAPGETNSSGLAQFTVTDPTVEDVTLVATDATANTEIYQTATVSFTGSEANRSTIVVAPTSGTSTAGSTASVPASGPTIIKTATVTVTLLSGGGVPLQGHNVSLLSSSSTALVTPATATTGSSGVANFTVSDPTVENVVLSALDRTSGVTLVPTVTVDFFANEANQSTATASPTVLKVRKSSTITVTLLGPTDAPIEGHTVALATGSSTTTVTPLTPGGVTDSAGQVQFSVTDTAEEVLSVTVTDTGTGATLYKAVQVTFTKP